MIIDKICDRIDGYNYNAMQFCRDVSEYGGYYGNKIAFEMVNGTEDDVKKAICEYIDNENYNKKLKVFINSVNWL